MSAITPRQSGLQYELFYSPALAADYRLKAEPELRRPVELYTRSPPPEGRVDFSVVVLGCIDSGSAVAETPCELNAQRKPAGFS